MDRDERRRRATRARAILAVVVVAVLWVGSCAADLIEDVAEGTEQEDD